MSSGTTRVADTLGPDCPLVKRGEKVSIAIALVLFAIIIAGTLLSAWSFASLLGFALYFLIAGLIGVLVWGFRGRLERKSGAPSSPDFAILMNGPVSVAEGSAYAEVDLAVKAGHFVSGSVNERFGRIFDLSVKSRRRIRKAKPGDIVPPLFHTRGSNSSLGIPASPVTDTYVFHFEPVGDHSSREIVVYIASNRVDQRGKEGPRSEQ